MDVETFKFTPRLQPLNELEVCIILSIVATNIYHALSVIISFVTRLHFNVVNNLIQSVRLAFKLYAVDRYPIYIYTMLLCDSYCAAFCITFSVVCYVVYTYLSLIGQNSCQAELS